VPLLPDVIANFTERYYTAEAFRRRKPRGWELVPLFYKGREEAGITFTNQDDSRAILFNFHPSSYYFALFLLYSVLEGVSVSSSGINCSTDNLTEEEFNKYESCYKDYINYAKFSKHNRHQNDLFKNTIPSFKAQFTIIPPAFRVGNYLEFDKYKADYSFIPTPEETVIHICLTDLFSPRSWCWCLAPKS